MRCAVLRLRALAWLAGGRRTAALHTFRKILALRPCDRHALASAAHLHAQACDLEAAVELLTRLTTLESESTSAWFNLGYTLQRAGRDAEAEQSFREALRLDPKMDRAWYGLALSLIETGRLEDAAGALQQNTLLQPMSPYGWYRLAEVRLALKQPEEAFAVLRHLQQFEPRAAAQLAQRPEFSTRLAGMADATH